MAFVTPIFRGNLFVRDDARRSRLPVHRRDRSTGVFARQVSKVRASIEEEVGTALKDAMRAKDTERLKALRTIRAAFLTALKAEGSKDKLSDKEAIIALRKLAKMRQESIDMFQKAARDDLVQAEKKELDLINHWLPSLASIDQMRSWAQAAVEKTGASKPADMGKVMGYVTYISYRLISNSLEQCFRIANLTNCRLNMSPGTIRTNIYGCISVIMKEHKDQVDGNQLRKIVSELLSP